MPKNIHKNIPALVVVGFSILLALGLGTSLFLYVKLQQRIDDAVAETLLSDQTRVRVRDAQVAYMQMSQQVADILLQSPLKAAFDEQSLHEQMDDARELPAGACREEIAETGANALAGNGAGPAAQYILVYHGAAVVFPHRFIPDCRHRFVFVWFGGIVTRVGRIARLRPFPSIPVQLVQAGPRLEVSGARMKAIVVGKASVYFLL